MDETPNSTSNDDEDRISALPDSILLHILSCKKIYMSEIVRTSILSRRWRYLWTSLPILRFSDETVDNEIGFLNFVDNVLHLHDDSIIHKLFLSCNFSSSGDRIDSIIAEAVRRNVRNIHLSFVLNDNPLKLPDCLFNSEIRKIYLESWHEYNDYLVELPNSFWSVEHLNVLIISAQQLKTLSVIDIISGTKIKICTPNLTSLHLEGQLYDDYFLDNFPSLASACVQLFVTGHDDAHLYCKVLKGLYNVTTLTLSSDWDEVSLCPSAQEQLIPIPFRNLRHLKLHGCCGNAVANLLKFTPHIETLFWKTASEEDIAAFYGGQFPLNCLLCELKYVEVHNLRGCEDELKLLEFIMKNASVIKIVDITPSAEEKEVTEFSNKLQSLSRASSSVNINFLSKSVTSVNVEDDFS
ncbi:hypothetical protein AQUCO_02800013v1 [Aquilegia coerulea]|uniref:FBD domain-containing protein n=1 Tax=Aquilegia coerulea TaxID=218851 RepID=A0A2G5D3I1_AQUCA|nr:hypothetical protein AQUCO_02800013v1 [Aquilegia coerulea]